jgi:hypothetical protein
LPHWAHERLERRPNRILDLFRVDNCDGHKILLPDPKYKLGRLVPQVLDEKGNRVPVFWWCPKISSTAKVIPYGIS